jgi:hypothetical protein
LYFVVENEDAFWAAPPTPVNGWKLREVIGGSDDVAVDPVCALEL